MSRSAMRFAQRGSAPRLRRCCAETIHGLLGLALLSACGVSESDRPPPGPFLGDWTEVTRIGEYETPAEEVFGSIRSAALIERGGVVLHSFPASDYADEAASDAPESIAWDLRDQAQSGYLVCAEVSGLVIHVPYYLGWVRAYTASGDLARHSALPDFVKRMVVPAAVGGAVKYEFDPDYNFSHPVLGTAVVPDTHLALSISVTVPRGQEPEVEGLLALLDLDTGSQTRRDEFGGIIMLGLGGRVAVTYRDPFPTLAILTREES